MRFQSLVLFLLVLSVSLAKNQAISVSYNPIKDINDPYVIEIARFAVTAYNKRAGAKLEFKTVIKGESKNVIKTYYRLNLSANNGSISNDYEAVVVDVPFNHHRHLISFKSLHS
ncbi:hypothetical protein TSUD_102470 [Trifolium subterraneum]|uniref:Cystatin domain-containing protein n=1 Tax=Trifolium subterraneum TaxID=3900 RepID=A0A2Z6N558_TRISU|nr:hypothetical protein TSUD_102470 [Trifolium subterraneum]